MYLEALSEQVDFVGRAILLVGLVEAASKHFVRFARDNQAVAAPYAALSLSIGGQRRNLTPVDTVGYAIDEDFTLRLVLACIDRETLVVDGGYIGHVLPHSC